MEITRREKQAVEININPSFSKKEKSRVGRSALNERNEKEKENIYAQLLANARNIHVVTCTTNTLSNLHKSTIFLHLIFLTIDVNTILLQTWSLHNESSSKILVQYPCLSSLLIFTFDLSQELRIMVVEEMRKKIKQNIKFFSLYTLTSDLMVITLYGLFLIHQLFYSRKGKKHSKIQIHKMTSH